MGRRAIIAGMAAALLAPAAAQATTVRVVTGQTCDEKTGCVTFAELRAEGDARADALRVDLGPDAVVIGDEAHPVEAGAGCEQADPRTVRCPGAGRFARATIETRDGDDRVLVTGALGTLRAEIGAGDGHDDLRVDGTTAADLDGGPGDDRLAGSPSGETLRGGPGADVVRGEGGSDLLTDGERTGATSADVLDGGPGLDRVSYAGRYGPVDVDLERPGANGEEGEGDTLLGVEGGVDGGFGPDVLRGTAGPDTLYGGDGYDTLDGRGGHDQLWGEYVTGGSGDDRVEGAGLLGLSCGPGRDSVVLPTFAVRLADDCEDVVVGSDLSWGFTRRPLRSLGGVVARLTGRCPRYVPRRCAALVNVRTAPEPSAGGPIGGLLLGRARGHLSHSGRAAVDVRLNRRGRRLVRRHHTLSVHVSAAVDVGLADVGGYTAQLIDP